MEIIFDNKKFKNSSEYLKYLYSKPYKENKNKELVIKTNVEELKKDVEDFRNNIVDDLINDLKELIENIKSKW